MGKPLFAWRVKDRLVSFNVKIEVVMGLARRPTKGRPTEEGLVFSTNI